MKILELMDEYDGFLFDIWGVICEGAFPYPRAIEMVNEIIANKEVLFVSNAPREKNYSASFLRKLGLHVTPEMIVTSGEIARGIVSDKEHYFMQNKPKLYHLGAEKNEDILTGINVEVTTDISEAGLLFITCYRDEEEDVSDIEAIFQQAAKIKMPAICVNPDTIIVNQGKLRYCSGYFAPQYQKLGGEVIYTGKPWPPIFEAALEIMAQRGVTDKNKILMVGDTLETDIIGAINCDIPSALVTSGNAGKLTQAVDFQGKRADLSKAAHDKNIVPKHIIEMQG